MSKFQPASLPDEVQVAIRDGQAANLAQAVLGTIKSANLTEASYKAQFIKWKEYFFNELMSPWEPLKKARAEAEAITNIKSNNKERYEKSIDYGDDS